MRAAFGFLTSIPAAVPPTSRTLAWFPLVGLVLGTATGGVWWAASEMWPPLVAAVVVVAADLALTGMLHVDGLADTADGLLVHGADPGRRLEIMRAPDVGAYGAAVVALVLVARVAGLAATAPSVLLVAGVWAASRSLMALVPALVPYARTDGLASSLLGAPRPVLALGGIVAGGALAAVAVGPPGALAVVTLVAAGGVVVVAARRHVGGFTGDVLGAAGVVGETTALLVLAARW